MFTRSRRPNRPPAAGDAEGETQLKATQARLTARLAVLAASQGGARLSHELSESALRARLMRVAEGNLLCDKSAFSPYIHARAMSWYYDKMVKKRELLASIGNKDVIDAFVSGGIARSSVARTGRRKRGAGTSPEGTLTYAQPRE